MRGSLSLFALLAMMIFGGCAIKPPAARPFDDGINWVLFEPLIYQIGNSKEVINVPSGFVTDYASVPRGACFLLSSFGRHASPAVVHDYLYWQQCCTKDESDRLFARAMKEQGVPTNTLLLIYDGVHYFGEKAWEENKNLRQKGMPRVIPSQLANINSGDSWVEIRSNLKKAKVAIDPSIGRQQYCSMGLSPEEIAELRGEIPSEFEVPIGP